jgi:hypothetical protein
MTSAIGCNLQKKVSRGCKAEAEIFLHVFCTMIHFLRDLLPLVNMYKGEVTLAIHTNIEETMTRNAVTCGRTPKDHFRCRCQLVSSSELGLLFSLGV